MSEELQIYRTYASFVKRSLLIGGLCPNARKRNIIYRCLSLWSIFSCFISLCSVGNYCRWNTGNISLLTASVNIAASMLNVIVKASCFFIHTKKLRQADDILDTLLEDALGEARVKSVAFFSVRPFYRLIYAQATLMAIAAVLYSSKPVITMAVDGTKNMTDPQQYPLPLPTIYPWTIDSMLIWQLHYIFETNVCWFIFSVSVGADAFFGFCMFRMSVLLRLLAFEFGIRYSGCDRSTENRGEIFKRCIDRHVLLLKCRDIVQNVYGPAILLVTVTNSVGMCTLIYQAFQISDVSIGKAGTLAVYFSMKLIQTFLYAWPGDVIVTESELFRREIYFSGWHEHNDTSFTKHFLLMMMQRPIIMRACDLLQVSLDLFAKILNTTVSYYFLLETLDSDS